ncbi:serine hydrolase [Bacillus sp. B-jedd]|uniref:serine hydrolase n=1 Tax=Bacillus sp. B-jedd TaxID=1476857 RepID=UPI0005155E1F|nr:serine hydrolase [Bacillus sp. B-jedd]CEG29100.1 beta-lactamase class A-like protein [Bacillus sp. B-jedd]
MRIGKIILSVILVVSIFLPGEASAAGLVTAQQNFSAKLAPELNKYIKSAGGTVTLKYEDLVTGDTYTVGSALSGRAASTIKLPLAIYVMELASKGKLNLNQKLVYKKYHYYGGSGVIRYQKVGTSYTIRDLVQKAMVHSDNIAFIMLRERVGKANFITYMKSLGAKNAYPNGQNLTSPNDLAIYAKKLYNFSKVHPLGKELDGYLRKTVYNTTIPKGIPGIPIAHKVGMIPDSKIYNDVAVIYDKTPYTLSVMTKNISYEKSQRVIAGIASIVHKHHKAKEAAIIFRTKADTPVYLKPAKGQAIGALMAKMDFKVKSIQGEWAVISFGKGTAYIERKLIIAAVSPGVPSEQFITIPQNNSIMTTAQNAAIQSSPGGGGQLGTLFKGIEIFIYGETADHYLIEVAGRKGYIKKADIAVPVQPSP